MIGPETLKQIRLYLLRTGGLDLEAKHIGQASNKWGKERVAVDAAKAHLEYIVKRYPDYSIAYMEAAAALAALKGEDDE